MAAKKRMVSMLLRRTGRKRDVEVTKMQPAASEMRYVT